MSNTQGSETDPPVAPVRAADSATCSGDTAQSRAATAHCTSIKKENENDVKRILCEIGL